MRYLGAEYVGAKRKRWSLTKRQIVFTKMEMRFIEVVDQRSKVLVQISPVLMEIWPVSSGRRTLALANLRALAWGIVPARSADQARHAAMKVILNHEVECLVNTVVQESLSGLA